MRHGSFLHPARIYPSAEVEPCAKRERQAVDSGRCRCFWTGAALSGLLLLPALVCCGLSRLIWSAAERLQIALTLHGNPDCQKICQAKSFEGKKSVKD